MPCKGRVSFSGMQRGGQHEMESDTGIIYSWGEG